MLARVAGPQVDLRIRSSQNVIKVRLDPSEMEQIVINLVINACDAMDGAGKVEVAVSLAAPDRRGARRVRTAGRPAGPADDQPTTAPGWRRTCCRGAWSRSSRPRSGARGRGSACPRSTAWSRSAAANCGSTRAPATGTVDQHLAPHGPRRPAQLQRHQHRGRGPPGKTITGTVLLVEDDDELRQMAEDVLVGIGLDVISAESAELALQILSQPVAFDALVTDIMLPGISGVELVDKARAAEPDLPVLYMTGYSGAAGQTRITEQGDRCCASPTGRTRCGCGWPRCWLRARLRR